MSEQQNKQPEEKKRTPYMLEVDPEPFKADAEVKILTSNDLCSYTNKYFRAAFNDYEGCFFVMEQGMPTLTLTFNHAVHKEDGMYAVNLDNGKDSGNSILDRVRLNDRRVREGDRYKITDDGIDIIKSLLAPRYFNNNKPNWGTIVVDYVDRPNSYYGAPTVQLTKIIGIDPRAICSIIWGKKDKVDDSWVDYIVEVKADLSAKNNFGMFNPNYVLYITRANNNHLTKTYEKLGFGNGMSNIIRQ